MILIQRSIKDKSDFVEWSISGSPQEDKNGWYVRIGSWTANFWFHVSIGKTVKQTLGNAKRRLPTLTDERSTYEYIETEPEYSELRLIKFLENQKQEREENDR
ncbi:MAG: hypothetical protein KAS32_04815 [Candidatus Peribacteraceae bacterium]|nr:hypothetical protein [Candidatus Peribacteraceae bacterium]